MSPSSSSSSLSFYLLSFKNKSAQHKNEIINNPENIQSFLVMISCLLGILTRAWIFRKKKQQIFSVGNFFFFFLISSEFFILPCCVRVVCLGYRIRGLNKLSEPNWDRYEFLPVLFIWLNNTSNVPRVFGTLNFVLTTRFLFGNLDVLNKATAFQASVDK